MDQTGLPQHADPGLAPGPLSNHWRWRPEWGSGRAFLWWYLTFDDQHALHHFGCDVQCRLRDLDYLDVIPPRWLHLTVQDIAFADELSPGQVGMLTEIAGRCLADSRPRQLRVGPVTTMPGAVVLRVAPAEAITHLRGQLTNAMAEVSGIVPARPLYAISPHVSLAYVNRDCDAQEVGKLPSGLSAESTAVEMTKVTLAAVTRKDRCYRWKVCAEISLTGRPGDPRNTTAGALKPP